jgi:valyl-tRNA synthetase
VLKLLLNAETLDLAPDAAPRQGTPTTRGRLGELYLPLEGLIDVAAERARLEKEVAKINAEIAKVQEKLGNPAFVQKVPPHVLEEHRRRLQEWQAKFEHARKASEGLPPG